MSIRVHALAKELNVPSKELVDFINSRKDIYGLEIKTSSNTIADLYAEEIIKDFKATAVVSASNESTEEKAEKPAKSSSTKKSSSKSSSAKKSTKSSSGKKTASKKKKADELSMEEQDIMTLEESAANAAQTQANDEE